MSEAVFRNRETGSIVRVTGGSALADAVARGVMFDLDQWERIA